MKGSIIGDIIGSAYEFNNISTKDFPLFSDRCSFTDDTVMTVAVMKILNDNYKDIYNIPSEEIVKVFQETARKYPDAGYGSRFINWVFSDDPQPYNSCGNGAAMRICPAGMVADGLPWIEDLSKAFTAITHNHPEGLKGAECAAACVYQASHKGSKDAIRSLVEGAYYPLDKTCEDYRRENACQHGKEICQVTVPQAIECFLESRSFEDCMRNCVSIGGDSDTIAAIAGGIAEAYYGVPEEIWDEAKKYLPEEIINEVVRFENIFRLYYPHKEQIEASYEFPEGNWDSSSYIEIFDEEMGKETFGQVKKILDKYEKSKEHPRAEEEYLICQEERYLYSIDEPVSKKDDFLKGYNLFKEIRAIAGDAVCFTAEYTDWTEASYRWLDVDYDEKLNPGFTLTTILKN